MRLRIRTRLTLVFALVVAVVLTATCLFVYLRFQDDLRATVDAGLKSRAQTLSAGVEEGVGIGEEEQLIDPDESFAQVVSPTGEVLDSSPALTGPLLPREVVERIDGPTYLHADVNIDEPFDARLLAVPSRSGPIVIVGASLEEQDEAVAHLAGVLVFGGLGALALTTLIGWAVAGAALRPVEKMRAEAAAISADEPGRRLPVADTGDEIARLGETLNRMLERLEVAMERERRFVDDASHELRTPLGILKTELEIALRRARTTEELEAVVRSAAEESERLSTLAEELLVLARADRGRLEVHREPVDLASLAHEVAERFEAPAGVRAVTVTVEPANGVNARADPVRLKQALDNLIANAVRHSPPGGSVSVRVAHVDGTSRIEVADSGDGFPAAFIERAFEPFARADEGRVRSAGGAGLGLAIVKAVAESHGGTAEAHNAPSGGATVTISIPD